MSLQSHPLQTSHFPLVHALTGPNGPAVEMRKSDGYINATKMCKAAGKLWGHFRSTASTEAFLKALAANIHITISNLVQSERGGCHTGTWVHPQVAIQLAGWCSPEFGVAVTDLVLRYCKGEVTTEESQNVAQNLRDVAGEPWKPCSIGGVSDITGSQLYIGIPSGTFVDVRMVGTRPVSADEVDITNVEEGVILKFGKSEFMPRRNSQHGSAFGGFQLLDHLPVKDPGAAERRLKNRLDAQSMRLRGRHWLKQVEDTELVRVRNQDEYKELYDMAAWAAGDEEDIQIQRERMEWDGKIALEHEKTEQLRLQTDQKRMDHEWRMMTYSKPTAMVATQEPIQEPLQEETPSILQVFADSEQLVYDRYAYMKVADLRKAGGIGPRTSLKTLRDVFEPRGVRFSNKSNRVIPGTMTSANTLWVDGVRLATENEMDTSAD